jgi:hypothetical protein
MVAIARPDGHLVPFATFDGEAWRGPVPGDASAPPTIADHTTPWFAGSPHPQDGWRVTTPITLTGSKEDTRTVVTSEGAVQLDAHCQRVWALVSDLMDPATPDEPPSHDLRVAFSGERDGAPTAAIDVTLPDDAGAAAFLFPHFVAAEAREAGRRQVSGEFETRPTGATAAGTPFALSALRYVGRRDGRVLYRFEARRIYPRPPGTPDAGCDLATVMSGWLSEQGSGGFGLISSDLAFTDCDRKGTPIVQPLASMELAGRLFVVTVDRHYESESYSIYDVSPGGVSRVLTVDGGGC